MKRPATRIETHPTEPSTQPEASRDTSVTAEQGDQRSDAAEHPWLQLAGIFADDPALMPMLDEIYAARDAERDAQDAAR